jgi:XTP/dITP diphosphohydrolase
MQRTRVDSSDIVSVGYDVKSQVLELEFKENRVYQYFDVPSKVHDLFMKADSYGEYFYASINKHYRYKRVSTEDAVKLTPVAIAFATGNARKLRDLQLACEPFDIAVEGLDLPVDEVQSYDAEEIAVKKAKHAYKLAGHPVVVNDSYWNILALRGFPGAYMSYVSNWLKADDFLALMRGKNDRTIGCNDTLVYYDGKRSKVFSATTWGKITDTAQGQGRTSLDQIVIIDGQTQTIAELEDVEARSSIDIPSSIYGQFAKWYNLQRRIGKRF